MKRRILTVPKSFRLTVEGAKALEDLAASMHRHPSELMRQAVVQYVGYHSERLRRSGGYRQHPF